MFRKIISSSGFYFYCNIIYQERLFGVVMDKSFARVNPDDYEEFDLEKYPDGLIPLCEYVNDWININDLLWRLDNGDVVLLMWEED